MQTLSEQITWLFLLALPIACVAWTVTHEEVFREIHEFCVEKSKSCRHVVTRKFFYLFTCEYCFSHYITIIFISIAEYHLLLPGWKGYLIGFFALVWIANVYMSVFAFIRTGLKKERLEATIKEQDLHDLQDSQDLHEKEN